MSEENGATAMAEPTKELKPIKPTMLQNKFSAMVPKDLNEAMALCKIMADSDIVPKEFQKKPSNLLIAIGMGGELGLSPFQAMQNIMVVNGKPAMWGDAVLGLVRASGKMEYISETYDANTKTAICKCKRTGEPEIIRTFSLADAVAARLDKKEGPWQNYQRRMLQMRARSWALRDGFTDILKGLNIVEEARDIVDTDIVEAQTAPREITPSAEPTPSNPVVDVIPGGAPSPTASPSNPPENCLTTEERKKVVELMKKANVSPEMLREHLEDKYGITEKTRPTAFVPRVHYAELCAWIETPQGEIPFGV